MKLINNASYPQFRKVHTPAVVLFLTVAAVVGLAGCANPGATTCDEYAAKSRSERMATEKALLEAHDLEPNAIGNAIGIGQAVDSFCGLNGITDNEAAKKNGSSPLEKAVDWTATKW